MKFDHNALYLHTAIGMTEEEITAFQNKTKVFIEESFEKNEKMKEGTYKCSHVAEEMYSTFNSKEIFLLAFHKIEHIKDEVEKASFFRKLFGDKKLPPGVIGFGIPKFPDSDENDESSSDKNINFDTKFDDNNN